MDITEVPTAGQEKETIKAFLDANRDVMIWKADGMSDEAGRTAPFSSDTSIIGLLQHLAVVEKSWFQNIFKGDEVDYGFDFDADGDAEWHFDGTETIAAAVAMYREAIAESNRIIDAADLDEVASKRLKGEEYSLRWIVVHMIEETARHAGHADIVREHIEGTTGYLPGFG